MEIKSDEREKMASRLKQARSLSGLSQAQAALKLGLQRPAISELESAKRKVSAEEILLFAQLYKVDPTWLLMGESEIDPSLEQDMQYAARELSKLSRNDMDKVLHVIKLFPKE